MIPRARGGTSAGPVGQAREQWLGTIQRPSNHCLLHSELGNPALKVREEFLGPCTTQGCRDRPWATPTHPDPKPLQCPRLFSAHFLSP